MATRLGELVDRLGGRLIGDPNTVVHGIAPMDDADASQLSFHSNPKLRAKVAQSHAAAVILTAADAATIGQAYAGARIVCDNPYAYFAIAAQRKTRQQTKPAEPGIDASAVGDPTAR